MWLRVRLSPLLPVAVVSHAGISSVVLISAFPVVVGFPRDSLESEACTFFFNHNSQLLHKSPIDVVGGKTFYGPMVRSQFLLRAGLTKENSALDVFQCSHISLPHLEARVNFPLIFTVKIQRKIHKTVGVPRAGAPSEFLLLVRVYTEPPETSQLHMELKSSKLEAHMELLQTMPIANQQPTLGYRADTEKCTCPINRPQCEAGHAEVRSQLS